MPRRFIPPPPPPPPLRPIRVAKKTSSTPEKSAPTNPVVDNTPAAYRRSSLPSPAALGLNSSHAEADLEDLGWRNEESVDLCWALSGAADPDAALNALIRLYHALREEGGEKALDTALRNDPALLLRLICILGGSTALADHLVANAHLWQELDKQLPRREEMFASLLGAIEATPLNDDGASASLTTAGTYRAGVSGAAAEAILKREYRTLMLRIAAYDLAGTAPESRRRVSQDPIPMVEVTSLLADAADAALTAALAVAAAEVTEEPLNLAVIAMGKCGGRELNYISDVDVIFVADPADAQATRVAGEFIRIGCTAFFEVDAALRPEGKRGALVRSLDSHVTYYKRWADTWEFQALLKARPMTGDMRLGQQYIDAISPMVWEASQRKSFVEDVQSMRRRVLENVPAELRERELKLGEGGLRDVEFAVQLLQLVHGRSDEGLRDRSTLGALGALVAGGYVGREDGAQLAEAYAFLRLLEHRLQLQRLKRTHTLPPEKDKAALFRLATTSGFSGTGTQSAASLLQERLRKVRLLISTLHSRLFYRPLLSSVVTMSVGALKLSPESAKLQLAALGYTFPDRAFEHLTALAAGTTRRAKIQAMLLPTLMEWLSATADPDAGLLNYRKLSEAAHDRNWFLRMLRDEGIVGQRLMKILGTSPFTADLIISHPDTVKILGDGASGPKLLDAAAGQVSTSLVAAAGRQKDPEKAISVARSLRRAELARIASADLLGMMDTKTVCVHLSLVWDAVLDAALQAEVRYRLEQDELAEAPARIAVIGMGRLGGAELGYGSDADVMFVCEPAEGVSDTEAVKWSINVCESMRQRLSKPSGDPPLEVDLGLRPEGRSGAAVRTIDSYERYYRQWGEVWEIQALLRAQFIAGDPEVGEKFLQMINPIRYPEKGVRASSVREVRRMKARVDTERLPRGADRNTHTKLGRGALTDIEWTVQLLCMMHGHRYPQLHDTSTLTVLDELEGIDDPEVIRAEDVRVLRTAWLTATAARNALVLVRGRRTDQLPQPGPHLAQVAGAAGWDPHDYQEFLEHYLKVTRRARRVVDEVFWGEPSMEP